MDRLMEKKANRESLRAQQSRRIKIILRGACVLALLITCGSIFINQGKQNRAMDNQISELNAQMQQQLDEKAHAERERALRQTEEYQKLNAKKYLGYVEPEEKVFIDVSAQ